MMLLSDDEKITQADKRSHLEIAPGKSIKLKAVIVNQRKVSLKLAMNQAMNLAKSVILMRMMERIQAVTKSVILILMMKVISILEISDINIGDFTLVKYKFYCSMEFYIGECRMHGERSK